jgi:DNA-binding NtrC family response regulator
MAKILIVDDEERILDILKIMLEGAGHKVFQAANGRYAVQVLQTEPVDMVISDICMDEIDGLKLLSIIRKNNLGCPVVFITAFGTLQSAVEALRLGAVDYLVKPFEEKDVILAVERALGMRSILAENAQLRQQYAVTKHTSAVFSSPAMQKVRQMAIKVAPGDATVLLTGESGTGKEVISRFIHYVRKKGRFVAVNCAAIAPSLLEAELFGHEKGAFTGADKTRAGKFEFAGDGTLFLDEIGEMPIEAQAKLLRAIQERSIQRVGGNQETEISCRLICATNKDLTALVKQGKFREDLYYRLAVFPIHLPPLRERRQDIDKLVYHCLEKLGALRDHTENITPAACQLLQQHSWPGNIRELFNTVERAVIMKSGDGPLTSDDFSHLGVSLGSQQVSPFSTDGLFNLPAGGIDYDEFQRNIVKQALDMAQGNQTTAAKLLNVTRAKFRTLLGLLDN